MDTPDLCRFYFMLGLSYKHILCSLSHIHNVLISMRTLKRILCTQNLFRQKFNSDILDVAQFVEKEINGIGYQQGYRWIHLRCIQEGLVVPRDTIAILMQILDPIGVEIRLRRKLRRRQYFSRGPDFLWHLDSYDKLKQYGLCINGCIDGYSRQIIWVNVYRTASRPRLIASYYMEAVKMRWGCPFLVRGDCGTENGHVAVLQEFLTERKSFLYGRSTANQRIEMFWNFLRKQCCQYWIDKLSGLKDRGQFDGSLIDTNLSQFCFIKVLQGDIDDMIRVWNTHVIRPSKNLNCPSGRPVVLYTLPRLQNTRSYLHQVDNDQVEICEQECEFRSTYPCDHDFFELCTIYMEENNWQPPTDADEAVELFINLKRCILADL